MRENLAAKKYTYLREAHKDKGWLLDLEKLRNSGSCGGQGSNQSAIQKGGSSRYLGSTVAAISDSKVMGLPWDSVGVCTAYGGQPHLFTRSTLLDNYGATHLVNDTGLLDSGSLIRTNDRYVICGSTSIDILGRGRRSFEDDSGRRT